MKKTLRTLTVFLVAVLFCGSLVASPRHGRPGPGRPPVHRNYGRPAPPPVHYGRPAPPPVHYGRPAPPPVHYGPRHYDHGPRRHHDHGPSRGWWNGALVVGATLGLLDIATRAATETTTVERTTVIQPVPVQSQPMVIYTQPAPVQQPTVIYTQPAPVQQPAVIYTQPSPVTPASVIYR
ncbi:MAG: hypothetical protein ACI4Q0_00790 [Oligosphaeraceae bacterium]